MPELKEPYDGPVLANELPEATGDNRFFKGMKSGYAGEKNCFRRAVFSTMQ